MSSIHDGHSRINARRGLQPKDHGNRSIAPAAMTDYYSRLARETPEAAPVFTEKLEPLSSKSSPDLGDMTLEEFADKHLTRRDELAFRALSGEVMSPREEMELKSLNDTLKRLLPRSAPMPPEVGDAIAEVHRLVGR